MSSPFAEHVLPNGLRLVFETIPRIHSTAIGFLSRGNFLNVWIGRLTYGAQKKRQAREEQERDEAEIERLASQK